MTRIRLGVAALLLAAVAGGTGWWIGHGPGASSPLVSAPAGRRVLYWHDPMMPGQKFDKPGKSPFMDMQLVPVYADPAGDAKGVTPAAVAVDGNTRQALALRSAPVTSGVVASTIKAVGTVAVDERSIAVVQARTNGFVQRLHVRAQYDPVRRGQTLVTITAPEWAAAQEDYLALRRAGGAGLLDAARARMRLAGMSVGDIAAVGRTGRVQSATAITAPVGGYVAELMVREGMTVAPGQTLARIAGLGTVWIDAQIPEAASGGIKVGDRVTVETPAYGGEPFAGRVIGLLPLVSADTRTRSIRVAVANSKRRLVPGMTATITFGDIDQEQRLLVPTEAVIRTGQRTLVFVDRGKGRYEAAAVSIGRNSGENTEILAGLRQGERVVVSGQFLLDSEASLRGLPVRGEAPKSAAAAPKSALSGNAGTGIVEAIKPGSITLSHEPITGLGWPAMTMAFSTKLPSDALPKPGTKVDFTVVIDPKAGATVTAVAPVAK